MSSPEEIVDLLYNALSNAETGSFKNPWIRAVDAPKQGSTAFGPAQITRRKVRDYANRGIISPESVEFYDAVLEPMYSNFVEFGREPKKQGYKKEYDYGGTGFFDPASFQPQYEQLAKEMIIADYITTGGNVEKTVEKWRGKPRSEDQRYYKAVDKAMTAKHGLMSLFR